MPGYFTPIATIELVRYTRWSSTYHATRFQQELNGFMRHATVPRRDTELPFLQDPDILSFQFVTQVTSRLVRPDESIATQTGFIKPSVWYYRGTIVNVDELSNYFEPDEPELEKIREAMSEKGNSRVVVCAEGRWFSYDGAHQMILPPL